MANAFIGRGAKAYIGFHNSVFADYSREFMKEYVNNLIEGRTSDEAYETAIDKYGDNHEKWFNATYSYTLKDYTEKYKKDPEVYNPLVHIAYPVHSGNKNAVLVYDGLQNGGFEFFNFLVPDGVETLYFNYNFISEEPMEFVGSIFDDSFGVRISKGGKTVWNQQYESINTSEWKEIEGINFAGGDSTAFQTDWKTAEIDVSAYCGNVITLSFIIYDVGDQIYDSACVIDNVMLQ